MADRDARPGFIDWKKDRGKIDLLEVATELLGPAPGRPGERNGKSRWWHCPFHDDENPSFLVTYKKERWSCRGCGVYGDAANLVMKLKGVKFPQALKYLFDNPAFLLDEDKLSSEDSPDKSHADILAGLSEEEASQFVSEAETFLHSPEGQGALSYLTDIRCLTLETICSARLGFRRIVRVPTRDGWFFFSGGWVIPAFDANGEIASVQIRRVDDSGHKYDSIFLDRTRMICYPNTSAILPGCPLIVVEGAFDVLVLKQVLTTRASVVTLGSAANSPDHRFYDFSGVPRRVERMYVLIAFAS